MDLVPDVINYLIQNHYKNKKAIARYTKYESKAEIRKESLQKIKDYETNKAEISNKIGIAYGQKDDKKVKELQQEVFYTDKLIKIENKKIKIKKLK